jgi:hypothetical protein
VNQNGRDGTRGELNMGMGICVECVCVRERERERVCVVGVSRRYGIGRGN